MLRRIATSFLLAVSVLSTQVEAGKNDKLCSISPGTYDAAMKQYPDAAFAINELKKQGIAAWYSDNVGDYASVAKRLVESCDSSTRMTLIVYGIPNKDCEHGYSNRNSYIRDSGAYKSFLNTLTSTVGNRKILYVLEPDAVGLLAKEDGCGEAAGYRSNLKLAISTLSTNPNAEIYLDVGYWTLNYPGQTARVAKIVSELASMGNVKGITLNTSNYRPTSELIRLCGNFQNVVGSKSLNCVVDTSRNYNDNIGSGTEWCNSKSAGIGRPPTGNTGAGNIDYFIWIKPPGESDGTCERSGDSLQGPEAGAFFKDHLQAMWNNGYFVKELNMPKMDGTVRPIDSSSKDDSSKPSQPAAASPSPASASSSTQLPSQTDSSNSTGLVSADSSASLGNSDIIGDNSSSSDEFQSSDEEQQTTDAPIDAPEDNVQTINTKSEESSGVAPAFIALLCVVGVSVVGVVAFVYVKTQKKRMEEVKSPRSTMAGSHGRFSVMLGSTTSEPAML